MNSSRKNKGPGGLIGHVFSWSIYGIMNNNLYKYYVSHPYLLIFFPILVFWIFPFIYFAM